MTRERAERVKEMIENTCMRHSLAERCENLGVTMEEFEEFLELALKNAGEKEEEKKRNAI